MGWLAWKVVIGAPKVLVCRLPMAFQSPQGNMESSSVLSGTSEASLLIGTSSKDTVYQGCHWHSPTDDVCSHGLALNKDVPLHDHTSGRTFWSASSAYGDDTPTNAWRFACRSRTSELDSPTLKKQTKKTKICLNMLAFQGQHSKLL